MAISPKLITLTEVVDRVGFSRSTLYRELNRGTFPPAIKLSPRRCAWLESDVALWLQSRIQFSRPAVRIASG